MHWAYSTDTYRVYLLAVVQQYDISPGITTEQVTAYLPLRYVQPYPYEADGRIGNRVIRSCKQSPYSLPGVNTLPKTMDHTTLTRRGAVFSAESPFLLTPDPSRAAQWCERNGMACIV